MKQDYYMLFVIKKMYAVVWLSVGLLFQSLLLQSSAVVQPPTISYYLYIADFLDTVIEIPTSGVSGHDSNVLASDYFAGRAPIYNSKDAIAGICSASFLCMEVADGTIFTDISNFIATDDGLIVTWFTPTTLINLELDSIINGMVTECIVIASTKVGVAPFYGQTFNLVVSSDGQKIHFDFTRTGMIF